MPNVIDYDYLFHSVIMIMITQLSKVIECDYDYMTKVFDYNYDYNETVQRLIIC